MIRFLFKTILLLVLFFVVIAFWAPKSANNNLDKTTDSYSTFDALAAVRNTATDLGNFCERNPETCNTGKFFISSLGLKVRDGARIAYEFLDAKFGNTSSPESEPENNQPKITAPAQTNQPHGQKLSSKENHTGKK